MKGHALAVMHWTLSSGHSRWRWKICRSLRGIVLRDGWIRVSYGLRASNGHRICYSDTESAFTASGHYTPSPTLPNKILTQPQLSIKRLCTRFPPQEIFERLHLILTSPSLQDRMSVSSTLSGVHRISGEGSMEHVCAVDLGAEVAIVAGVVAADQMAKGCLAVAWRSLAGGIGTEGLEWRKECGREGDGRRKGLTPCVAFTVCFRTVQPSNFMPEFIVQFGQFHSFCLSVATRFMHCHIKDAEVQLS